MLRARDRFVKWAVVLGLSAGTAAASFRKMPDPDLPWHLAVGRAAVAARSLIAGDPFSFTLPGKYSPYEYVSDILLYAVHHAAPGLGLHLLLALCLGILLRLLWLRRDRNSEIMEWFVLALSLIALGPWLLVRPATLGFPILAGELLLIEKHRRGGGRGLILWLIPLQVLWANVHGFAVLGAGIIALYALLAAKKDRAAAAAAVAATCLSSFGPGIFLGPLRVADHSRFITEWTPASFDLLVHYDPAVLLLMVLASAAMVRSRVLFSRILVVGSMAMALFRFRLAPIFVIVSAPLIARELWPAVRGWKSAPWLAAAAGLAVPFGLMAQQVAPLGTGFDPAWLPVAACDFAEAHHLRGPVWNNLAFGGYMIWRFPDQKVFIDGRTAHLYPPEFMEDAWKAETDPAAFAALDKNYGFAWAMTDARGGAFGLTLAQDKRWAMVYLDDRAAIYVNKSGLDAGAAPAYQFLRHLTTGADLLAAPPPLAALRHDVSLAMMQSPQSLHVRAWSAALAVIEKR
jgi:hypothetical protein